MQYIHTHTHTRAHTHTHARTHTHTHTHTHTYIYIYKDKARMADSMGRICLKLAQTITTRNLVVCLVLCNSTLWWALRITSEIQIKLLME